MSSDNIIRLFRDDEGPGLSAEAKRRIVAAATAEYDRQKFQPREWYHTALWAAPAALGACLSLALIFMTVTLIRMPHTDAEREKRLLAEFNTVFAGRLQAVITTGGKTQIVLSEAEAPRGQPVAIHVSAKGQEVDVLSFSGQNVSLSLGGEQISFDALVDGKGGVILAGEKLFWHDGKTEAAPDVKIKAEALEM